MNVEKLFQILVNLALVENPNLHDGQTKHVRYLEGMRKMTQLYAEVGAEGRVYSADVDTILLAIIGYGESRHIPNVKDGDCSYLASGTVCNAFGPMQLSRSAPHMLRQMEPEKWKGTTIKTLRDPQKSVEGAYRILRHWKDQCSGSVDTLMGNWSAGKCLGGPISFGAHRCHLAKALGEAAGVEIKCQKAPSKRTEKMVQGIRKLTAEQAAKAEPKAEGRVAGPDRAEPGPQRQPVNAPK